MQEEEDCPFAGLGLSQRAKNLLFTMFISSKEEFKYVYRSTLENRQGIGKKTMKEFERARVLMGYPFEERPSQKVAKDTAKDTAKEAKC